MKRELEVLTPHPGEDGDVHMSDRSSSMTGTVLPPGLRFPTGAICGNHLIDLTGKKNVYNTKNNSYFQRRQTLVLYGKKDIIWTIIHKIK